jgi:hypothetical protein
MSSSLNTQNMKQAVMKKLIEIMDEEDEEEEDE